MSQPRLVGQNFSMGGVSVTSRYDRDAKSGYLNIDIEPSSTPDQRMSVAHLIRQFADDLERANGATR